MELASRRDPFAILPQNPRDKKIDHGGLVALINEVSRGWKLDGGGNPHEVGSQYSSSNGGPNTTLGLVLNGTDVDFMIPGGPAYVDDSLDAGDEILFIDGIPVDVNTVKDALKGQDEVGSTVRLTVRKAANGQCIEVDLQRASLPYVHHTQVYHELFDQLKRSCSKTDWDTSDLVKRLGAKVKELDTYHIQVEQEQRKHISRLRSALSKIFTKAMVFPNNGGSTSPPKDQTPDLRPIVEHLRGQLQAAQESEQRMREQLAQIKVEVQGGTGRTQSSYLKSEVDRLQTQVHDAHAEKGRSAQQIKQLELTIRQLKTNRDAITPSGPGQSSLQVGGEQESRRGHYIVMEDQIDSLSGRLRAAEGSLEHRQQELDEAVQREKRANDKLVSATKQVEEKSREASRLQGEVRRLEREALALQDAPMLRAQMGEADRQLHKAIAREGAVEAQLGASQQRVAELERSLRVQDAEWAEKHRALGDTHHAAQSKERALSEELEAARAAERAAKQAQAQAREEVESLRRGGEEREREHDRTVKVLEEEAQSANVKAKHLSAQLEDAAAAHRRLKAVLSEATIAAERNTASHVQAEKELRQKLEAVQEELQRSNAKVQQLRERERELCTRETSLSRRVEQSEEELRGAQGRVRELERDAEAAGARAEEMAGRLRRGETEQAAAAEAAAAQLQELRTQKAEAVQRMESAQEEGRRVQRGLEEARATLGEREEANAGLAARMRELGEAVQEREATAASAAAEAEENARAWSWQVDALKDRLRLAEEQIAKATEREEELLGALEASQTSAAALECSSVQKDLLDKQQIAALQLRVKALSGQLAQAKDDAAGLRRLLDQPPSELLAKQADRKSVAALSAASHASHAHPPPPDPLFASAPQPAQSTAPPPPRRSSLSNPRASPGDPSPTTTTSLPQSWRNPSQLSPREDHHLPPPQASAAAPGPPDAAPSHELQARKASPAALRTAAAPPPTAAGPGKGEEQGELPRREADLQAQVQQLRQRMRAMEADIATHPIRPAAPANGRGPAIAPSAAASKDAGGAPQRERGGAAGSVGASRGGSAGGPRSSPGGEEAPQPLSPQKLNASSSQRESPRKALTPKMKGVLAGLSSAAYVPAQARGGGGGAQAQSENPQPHRGSSAGWRRGAGPAAEDALRSHEPYLI